MAEEARCLNGEVSDIVPADFANPALRAFLQAHLDDLAPTAPPESQHAFALDSLHKLRRKPVDLQWVATDDASIVGTVALADLTDEHAELKSMRTSPVHRGQGIGAKLLEHALADARSRGIRKVSLETGSQDFFAPAHALYRKAGFVNCDPFSDYVDDPNSTFMTLVF